MKPATFTRNSFYENLVVMRETNPRAFNSLSPVTHAALAQYEAAKRAAEQATEQGREAP